MKFKLWSSLLTCRPLTQGAFSKLPCLSHWERVAEGEVLRRLHAVAEAGWGVSCRQSRTPRRRVRSLPIGAHHTRSKAVLTLDFCAIRLILTHTVTTPQL